MVLINGLQSNFLSAYDRGLAYGDGVFRTLRVSQGRVHCWRRHYQKLQSDCQVLGLACPSHSMLSTELDRIALEEPECVLKIIITRGSGQRGYHVTAGMPPTRIIITSPLPEYPPSYYERGVSLRVCDLRLSLQSRLAGIKHLNRLENVMARREWDDASIAEGLLLDSEGYVIGGTMTNLFMLKGNELWTPDLTRCGVAGVQRKRVLERAAASGIPCAERHISLAQLLQANEIFLTNSVIGVWQVEEIGQNRWEPGAFTPKVRQWLNEPCDETGN